MGAAPLATPLATPLEPLHPWREMFWKLGGGATAVIAGLVQVEAGGGGRRWVPIFPIP